MNNLKKYYNYGYGDAGGNMNNENVGNREIAEFMGFNPSDKGFTVIDYDSEFMGHRQGNWEDVEYDTSWDWLMPVVEKIGQIDTEWIKEHDIPDSPVRKLFEMSIFTPINELYEAVHQFIIYFNNEKARQGI